MTIRRAHLDDVDLLAPLLDAYRQSLGQPIDLALARDFLKARLIQDEAVLFIAIDTSGTGVGFVQLFPSFSAIAASRTWILNDLYVTPGARRYGLGRELTQAAARFAKEQHATSLQLTIFDENADAQAFYESLGWKRQRKHVLYELQL
ncbi:GNAT family N-acetyltransferase [Halotalea alkalilenta]|uniref:N-acetyltransferase domain-containing protein n=1 Tax=Halotalea alkalilenta TaxID=376489 RepID=A0A172YAD2_9GAMM|nr:GNAT family N-acetyltransferase [Halotalea alkalilenta]ANF56177.1 hypothetical protein A5892_00780 [Halotalea alkalilenta]